MVRKRKSKEIEAEPMGRKRKRKQIEAEPNKPIILVTYSPSLNVRYRQLMFDVVKLLPHCRVKRKFHRMKFKSLFNSSRVTLRLDKMAGLKKYLPTLKEFSYCLFFECEKEKDVYLWMAKSPGGPCIKFLVNNVQSMRDLKLNGNHLKNSRPIVIFSNFKEDKEERWKILKNIIARIFTPPLEWKFEPGYDHVFLFTIVDGLLWFRNYEISVPRNVSFSQKEKADPNSKSSAIDLDQMILVEVGPRFYLDPVEMCVDFFEGKVSDDYYQEYNEVQGNSKIMEELKILVEGLNI